MGFLVVMYGCESWTIKKTEHDELNLLNYVLEKILESHLVCKESDQCILKEISPDYSLEGLMLKLKLQYFVHLM